MLYRPALVKACFTSLFRRVGRKKNKNKEATNEVPSGGGGGKRKDTSDTRRKKRSEADIEAAASLYDIEGYSKGCSVGQ